MHGMVVRISLAVYMNFEYVNKYMCIHVYNSNILTIGQPLLHSHWQFAPTYKQQTYEIERSAKFSVAVTIVTIL